MSVAPPDRKSGGLAHALWTLVKPSRFDARAPRHAGLRYRLTEDRGVPPLCDVYLPDGAGPHPSVIVVHGGGFVIGHRAMKPVRFLASRLVDAGHAVCAIDYRLLFRGGGLDAQLADVDAAARFWMERCEGWGCDPARVSMAGLSAGATLMLLHAARHERPYARLVSFYGASDFERVSGRRAGVLLALVTGSRDRRVWAERSPIRAHAPSPLLVIHGTADAMVPHTHSTRLHEARLAAGLPTELALFEGMRHGWLNDASLPETRAAIERVIGFLGSG